MWRDRGIDKRGRCRGPYVGWLWVWAKLRSSIGSAQPDAPRTGQSVTARSSCN